VLHKAPAAFALALTMVRSSLTRRQTFVLFSLFAVATPLGILAGAWVRGFDAPLAMIVKGVVLSLGAGTFLYMGTLHEMKRATLIEHCCKPSCFVAMLMGLGVTACVRWIVGEAHRF
jgi:zinc transporter ZupT